MTGNVTNNDASVGGIAGFNAGRLEDAKCVIDHVTFYGSVSSTHKQDNKYVGDQDGHLFRGVTISSADPIFQRTMSEDERVHFIGIYCPVQLEANNYANLYLASDGKLHCPKTDGFYLNSFRAGFLVSLGDEAAPSSIVINLGEATGIRSIDNRPLTIDNSWYTLDGRKLGGKPSQKGIYINKGIKVAR